MSYENPEITKNREARRASLSARTGELLKTLEQRSAAERLAWYRVNRGRFFFERSELAERIRVINGVADSRKDEVLEAAGRLLRHEFDILGSGLTSLGERIDWQRDFKSGISWRKDVVYPAWNWRKVDDLAGAEIYRGHFYSIDDASDLKMPWDLSSFFHLPVLCEAYLQTGDARYADEVAGQLMDWHRENPYPRGVNWTCAMVAGIRIANLAFAMRALEPEEFIGEMGALSILRHIKFILDFFEVDQDGRRNNHYVNNLVGLGFGAAEIAGTELGSDLRAFAFEEIERELGTQFSPDGTNYEGTIPYHRFAAESIILTTILLERNGCVPAPESRAQLLKILQFIDMYTKPNNLAPQFGDNDNGRILVLHDYARQEYRDHRHILAVGAAWLGVERLLTPVWDQSPDAVWILGRPAPRTVVKPALAVGLYNANGYGVAKTPQTSLVVRCGRINPMSGGGHNHCDMLSYEFHDRGQDVIIDPGAMIYSADAPLRNYARSTAAHNILQLDGLEQQAFEPRDLFAMQDRAAATLDTWEIQDGALFFRGHHTAYPGWRVVREMQCRFPDGALEVHDFVEETGAAAGGREFCGRLHLAAGIEAEANGPLGFRLRAGKLEWTVRFGEGVRAGVCEGKVSPSYGIVVPAAVLEYRFTPREARAARYTVERRLA